MTDTGYQKCTRASHSILPLQPPASFCNPQQSFATLSSRLPPIPQSAVGPLSNTAAPVVEMKLTVQDKLRYIGGIAKTIWDVQEPQTAQSSNRGQPLHETLFSVSGVMSTYWVKGWLYDEEIEMNEQSIVKTLTAGMQVRDMCRNNLQLLRVQLIQRRSTTVQS